MARPKEFEYNRVLDKAIDVFWCQGYEATSMQDLVNSMGINRQSIYDTFGDKHALFLAALSRYEEVGTADVIKTLETGSPAKEAIRQVLETVLRESAEDRRRGCMMTNSTVELALRDKEVAKKSAANMARLETALIEVLTKAQKQGEINPHHNVKALASFLFNNLQGLRVTSKATSDQQVLRNIVEVTLSVLN